ncbi:lipopolysaccharide biosynthesis protein [Sphingobacterium sp. SGG-5]|uniref:glycosyl transferase family 90 n=1 Tax=Sphingobacterium sp. SGG-5 TaxID=2710881 RepID=UPI0013EE2CA3|nr:glycosyl transferase family 90 [Sphingobacterium sp. SGG-5]NGM63277.1 lipopolysaccharide biosynthesis protein [Sphingobacterium sp. SGG-5]
MNFKRTFLRNRNNKIYYYIKAILREIVPDTFARRRLRRLLVNSHGDDRSYIVDRVNYYNKLERGKALGQQAIAIRDYAIPDRIRVYYFDSKVYLRYFDPRFRFNILPGDIVDVPEFPTIVKSRPIAGDNTNSILLNLDKSRHFNFIKDEIPFHQKANVLVGRSGFTQSHRALFFDTYAHHPMCNLKKAARSSDRDFLSITGHLQYKFILALEGNDVATNLKWIMSSNSIAVMPLPKYETWFMEGRLIPDYHFICIKDDYSDLEEKLNYYIHHEDKAIEIVNNAHDYIAQFKNRKREDVIALKVLQKYFDCTRMLP